MEFLLIFTALSIVNVIFSTYRSIVTIKGGIFTASIVSALYFGFYNVVLIYTVADFPLWQKIVITAVCNFVGVYVVKYMEHKLRKDKMWKFEMTVPKELTDTLHQVLDGVGISHLYVPNVGKYSIFNCYCPTQKESAIIKTIAENYNLKYFVIESESV